MSNIKKIVNEFLENMPAKRLLSRSKENIFQKREEEMAIKFSKYKVVIPWYLKPFTKVITSIAYNSFKNGLLYNHTDVLVFKRPVEHQKTMDKGCCVICGTKSTFPHSDFCDNLNCSGRLK
jgi:hypothetical protein